MKYLGANFKKGVIKKQENQVGKAILKAKEQKRVATDGQRLKKSIKVS